MSLMLVTWSCLAAMVGGQQSTTFDAPTDRTLAEVLFQAKWVSFEDDNVVRMYTDSQREEVVQQHQQHLDRHKQYTTKRDVLTRRKQLLEETLGVSDSHREYAVRYLTRYDRNRDGVLDDAERQAGRLSEKVDLDQDGQLVFAELLQYSVDRRRQDMLAALVGGAAGDAGGGRVVGGRLAGGGNVGAVLGGELAAEPAPEKVLERAVQFTELAEVDLGLSKLSKEFSDARTTRQRVVFYEVLEVSQEFLHVKSGSNLKWIPLRTIAEIKQRQVAR